MQLYNFLQSEQGFYLPPYKYTTLIFMRDLMSGNKEKILDNEVKFKQLAHYAGLSIEAIREFIDEHKSVSDCLPSEETELKKLPRTYLTTVCSTMEE